MAPEGIEDSSWSGVGPRLKIPCFEQVLCLCLSLREFIQFQEDRDIHRAIGVKRITLHGLHICNIDFSWSVLDYIDNALRTETVIPITCNEIGIIPWLAAIVCCNDISFRWVVCERQLIEWNETSPLIFIGPAWNGECPISVGAQGDIPWHLISNVSIYIGVQKILRRHVEVSGSFAELLPVLG